MDDYQYALNEAGDLTPGTDLRFAYSGAGVATLIDREGRGYRVAAGEHNLAGIVQVTPGAQALVLDSDAVFSVPPSEEAVTPAEMVGGWAEAGPVDPGEALAETEADAPGPYADMTNRELKALLDERGVEYPTVVNKAALLVLLAEGDAAKDDPLNE